MDRAIADLVASGIRNSYLRAGDRIPDFSLPNIRGEQVRVHTLLELGPIVLSRLGGGGRQMAVAQHDDRRNLGERLVSSPRMKAYPCARGIPLVLTA